MTAGMKSPVYMDHHATTPVDARVLAAMLPWFSEKFGNAASRNHAFGWEAEKAVERARGQVAAAIGAQAGDIVFTSGATEADNLALKGALEANASRGRHLVTAATEHKAVLDTARALERRGAALTVVPVRPDGLVDPDDVARALTEQTVLVSVMHANNEIGVLQPLAEIGALCRARGVLFHTDAAQSLTKVPLDVEAMNVDLASLSGHKIYGPKGVGALYVRRRGPRVRLAAQMDGGGHERGLRSGTLNVPAIVGFGLACELGAAEMAGEARRLAALRDRLWEKLRAGLDGVAVNGSLERRLPGNLNVSFDGVEAEALLLALDGVALSSGAACASATQEPSHVLRALGGSGDERALGSLRFGLGRGNTEVEVDEVAERLVREVQRLRALSPLRALAAEGVDPATLRWSGH
jgi:cysteine desulfurase